MAETLSVPPGTPNPLHGDGHDSPQISPAAPRQIPPPALAAAPSPLGSVRQYHHAESLPSDWNKTSLTGATLDDPTGSQSRERVLFDPEWASPATSLKGIVVGRFYSFLFYWIGYGISLMLVLTVLWLAGGARSDSPLSASAGVLFVGPLIGFLLDLQIMTGSSWLTPVGVLLLLAEPIVFYLYFFSDDLRERLKYFVVAVALLCAKGVIYALVSSPG